MKTIIVLVYLAIGVAVAAVKDYLGDISTLSDILNLVLAIVLWPLVLLGVDFEFDLGGDDNKRNERGGEGKQGDGKQGDGKGTKGGAVAPIGSALYFAYWALAGRLRRART